MALFVVFTKESTLIGQSLQFGQLACKHLLLGWLALANIAFHHVACCNGM